MGKEILTLAIFIAINALPVRATESNPVPSGENCLFYKEFSQPIGCQNYEQQSYIRTYGLKYCTLFLSQKERWPVELNRWREQTSVCLQEMLLDNPKRLKPGCYQLQEFAFDTHPICYKQAGICSLSPNNLLKIIKVIEMNDLRENGRNSLVQSLNVLACIASVWTFEMNDLFSRIFEGTRNQSEQLRHQGAEIISHMPVSSLTKANEFALIVLPFLVFKERFDGNEMVLNSLGMEAKLPAILSYKAPTEREFDKFVAASKDFSPQVKQKAKLNYTEKPTPQQIIEALKAAKLFTE